MRRRNVLGALSALATGGCLANPPGATGPRTPPTGAPTDDAWGPIEDALYVSTFEFDATDEGNLRATVVVGNRSPSPRTGSVTGTLTVGEERFQRSRSVRVSGDGRAEVALSYPATYEAFRRSGSFRPTVTE